MCTLQGGGILREGEDLEAGDEALLLADGLAAAMQALPLPAAYYLLPLTTTLRDLLNTNHCDAGAAATTEHGGGCGGARRAPAGAAPALTLPLPLLPP